MGEKLLAQLINEHHFWDITANKEDGMLRLPGANARWDKAKAEFIHAVEELFVEDACNGF